MVTKVINIKVQDGDLNQLENDLKQVDKQFKKVDQSADKASKSVDDVASNGGAIAILDSLTGGLATRLRDAYEASKLFNFSLKATRTALIATGIGAFVVALGAVVAYWDDIVGFITGANSELEETLDLQTELADESQRQLDLLDKQDNILKLQGKSEKEIRDIKRQQLKEVIAQREEELKLAKERLLSLQQLQKAGGSSLQQITRVFQSSIIALGTALDKVSGFLGLDTDFAGTATSGTSSLIESVFGTQEDIDQALQNVQTLEAGIIASRNRLAGFDLADQGDGVQRGQVSTVNELSPTGLAQIQEAEIVGEEVLKINQKFADKQAVLDAVNAKTRLQVASNLLSALSGLAEQGSAGAKAIAIAQAVISTYQGINKALAETTDFTPSQSLRFANAAAVGIAGFANVANILKSDSSGAITPSLNNASGNVTANVPSFNVVGTSGANQIIEGLQQDQQPIQAFVVGSNVTTQQELDRNIVETASIG